MQEAPKSPTSPDDRPVTIEELHAEADAYIAEAVSRAEMALAESAIDLKEKIMHRVNAEAIVGVTLLADAGDINHAIELSVEKVISDPAFAGVGLGQAKKDLLSQMRAAYRSVAEKKLNEAGTNAEALDYYSDLLGAIEGPGQAS